jgi:hypothetical protein
LRARGLDLAEQPLETRKVLLVMAAQVMRHSSETSLGKWSKVNASFNWR